LEKVELRKNGKSVDFNKLMTQLGGKRVYCSIFSVNSA